MRLERGRATMYTCSWKVRRGRLAVVFTLVLLQTAAGEENQGYLDHVVDQYTQCRSDPPSADLASSCCNRTVVEELILHRPSSPPESERKAIAYAKVSYSLCMRARSTLSPRRALDPSSDCTALATAAAAESGASPELVNKSINLTLADWACSEDPGGPECHCTFFSDSGGCSPGTFLNDTTAADCPPGYFCPPASNCLIRCTAGTYCPGRLQSFTPDGSCPGADGDCGVRETECTGGFFCKGAKEQEKCPSGSFCKKAVAAPRPCNAFAICKSGTEDPLDFTGGVLVVVLALMLFIILWVYQHRKWLTCRHCVKRVIYESSKRRRAGNDITDLVKLKMLTRRSDPGATLESEYSRGNRNQWSDVASDDDELLLGEGLNEPKAYSLDIQYSHLSLTVNGGGPTVLKGVSGQIKPGRVTAIMGPSGAGKSSFLGAITGKASSYGTIAGELRINGKRRQLRSFDTECGFVPQDDTMHRDLRVREVLQYQAELRLPKLWPRIKKLEKVAYVIKLLGLEDVVSSIVGDVENRGISGGQRKRVNIGMELVADPTFLALDEPTSGLDSTSSLSVLKALRQVAQDMNLTVIAVLHQPRYEIYAQFDDLLLLGKGGFTAFTGETPLAVPYFEKLGFKKDLNTNPADFVMDALCGMGDGPEIDFEEAWKTEVNADADSPRAMEAMRGTSRVFNEYSYTRRVLPPWHHQMWTCLKRFVVQYRRGARTHAMDLMMVAFGGACLGGTYKAIELSRYPAMATMSSLVVAMTTMIFSLRTFGNNTEVIRRETGSGTSLSAFYIAGNIMAIPMMLVIPLIYLSIVATLLAPRSEFKYHYIATLALTFCATGMSYFISAVFHSSSSQVVAVVWCLTSSMFSGNSPTIPEMDELSAGWVVYDSSFSRYYMEAIYCIEAYATPVVFYPRIIGINKGLGYTFNGGEFTMCCGALVGMGVFYRIAGYLVLWRTYVFKPGHYSRLCSKLRSSKDSRDSTSSVLTLTNVDTDSDDDDGLHPL